MRAVTERAAPRPPALPLRPLRRHRLRPRLDPRGRGRPAGGRARRPVVGWRATAVHKLSSGGASDEPASLSSSARTTRRRSFGWMRSAARGIAARRAPRGLRRRPTRRRGAPTARGHRRPAAAAARAPTAPPAGRDPCRPRRAPCGPRHDLVDRLVRELLVRADGDLLRERHDPHEPCRMVRRSGQDRQTGVQRGRVGRDDLGVEAVRRAAATADLPDAVGP